MIAIRGLSRNVVAGLISLALTGTAIGDEPPNSELATATTQPAYVQASELVKHLNPDKLFLRSSNAIIYDARDGQILYGREENKRTPIASLTKLMTAMVILDAKLPLDEVLQIKRADRDRLRGSRSRLPYGTKLTRKDALLIALAASENRAAAALARTYPGGKKAFVEAMNAKAKELGMDRSHFVDSTGLHDKNVSTAKDLVKMVEAAHSYALIREMSTTGRNSITDLRRGREMEFLNTNRLVRRKQWDVELSKTGYIAASGHCLVMQATIADRPLVIVLLNSWGKLSKFGDANRIKRWLIRTEDKVQRLHDQFASS
ncbi:MAG: D-alanyl-D-alanine endopeptidase [Gammaproteobacteria bacterium]|nr:D-alanyl-D-alanine endopeptidase [Gammaproteobacteria bacterium]